MKPASIISLVIAVLLIVIGLTTCFIGQNIAKSNNEYLFSETIDGSYIVKQDLTEKEISKIELIVENAEINIIGKSETSYIEFINFSENFYNLKVTNKALSFDEIPNITALFKFWENGFSFKGMRYILKFDSQPDPNLQKTINVYLASDHQIKIFDIEAKNCTLNIEGITTDIDYNLDFNTATINVETLKTNSYFRINADKDSTKAADSIKLNMGHSYVGGLYINATDLNADFNVLKCVNDAMVKCVTGYVNVGFSNSPMSLNVSLKSNSGLITVDDSEYHKSFINNGHEGSTAQFVIETDQADISVKRANSTQQNDNNSQET